MKCSVGKVYLFYAVCVAVVLASAAAPPVFSQQPPAAANPPASSAPSAAPANSQSPAPTAAPPAKDPAAANNREYKSDQVVVKIGNRDLTAADLEFAMQGQRGQKQPRSPQAREAVDQYILMVVLAQQAVANHLDDSAELRRQLELTRARWLAQTEFGKISEQTKPTDQEISQYYNEHPLEFEQLEIRQVTVRKKPAGATTNGGLTSDEAQAKAEEVRKALLAGADPKKLAEDLKTSGYVDAEPRTIGHGQLPKERDEELFKLKDGEFSSRTEDAQSVSYTQVLKHKHAELNNVTQEIQVKLHNQKVNDSLENLRKKAKVWMDPEYFATSPSAATPAPSASAPPSGSVKPPHR